MVLHSFQRMEVQGGTQIGENEHHAEGGDQRGEAGAIHQVGG